MYIVLLTLTASLLVLNQFASPFSSELARLNKEVGLSLLIRQAVSSAKSNDKALGQELGKSFINTRRE